MDHEERRAGQLPRVVRAERQGGQHRPQRPQHRRHQPDGGAGQGVHLPVGLLVVDEQPAQQLEQRLVGGVEHIGHLRGQRVADDHGQRLVGWAAHVGGPGRPGRLKARVGLGRGQVLLQDGGQAAEVGLAPVAVGALALLDDGRDGGLGRAQVGDRDQLDQPSSSRVAWASGGPMNTSASP